jgi:hypothetical protein
MPTPTVRPAYADNRASRLRSGRGEKMIETFLLHSQPMTVSPGSCSNAQAFCLLDGLGFHCGANLEDRDRLGLGVGRQPPNPREPSDVDFGRCRWAASGRPLGRTRTRGKWRGLAFSSSAICRVHRQLHHTRVFCRLFQRLASKS